MTINDIIAIGRQIAAETAEGGNTAARVGGVIEAIGEILKSQDYMSWQPAGNFDIEEYYEKNDQVFDEETNSCYVSLQTDNVGHPVNENDESYEEGWWMKVIDGASVLAAAAAATQAAAEANQAAEAARGIVYQAVDDHLDTESLKPVANQVVTQAINNLSENLQIREDVRDLSYDDFENIVYNSSGESSPAIQNKRLSSLQYFTSGDAGDSIKLNDNNLKIFIWVRKSASEFEQYLTGDGWTTNDVDIPSNINYYITLAWTNNAEILPASVAYPDAINVTKRIIVKDSQSITEEINSIIFFDEPNTLTVGDFGNFVYNKNAQITSTTIRITTYNYISTGENSHILHLTDNSFQFFVWYRISSSELIIGTNWTTQDFVIPPHVDYYITIANSENTKINPSLYYVVERHVMPKSRLTDIYNKLNKLSTHNIIWTQWNVGQFAKGAAAPNITPSTYNSMAIRWNDEVADEYAKVFGMIEYNPVFGKNVDNVDVSPDDVVWNDYPYKAIFRQPQTASYWGGTAILSKIVLSNAEKIKYTCYEGVVAPDPTTQHMMDEVAFMTVANMTYMGVAIKVVETVTAYNSSNRADNTYQRMAYQELVSRFGNEPYVIISGDFECVDKEDYDIFAQAGFTLCNGGDFGWFNTCMTSLVETVTELDNIIVKGFDIEDVVVRYNDLSDHFPLIATLKIKP